MEANFIFTTPLTIDVLEVKGKEEFFIEGYVSTKDKDLVNDIITDKCLKSMQRQIIEGNIKLDIEHEAFRGKTSEEKELNKTKIPRGRLTDATNDKTGLRVKGILNSFHHGFEEVKGSLVNKFLDAMSIAFIPTEIKHVQRNGEPVRLLDDVRLLNVALTGNPVNTHAQIVEVFTKSIDSLEDYQKAKEQNPEVELGLEVKTSRQQRQTAERNRAVSESESDDDDEEKTRDKKKKKETKNPKNPSQYKEQETVTRTSEYSYSSHKGSQYRIKEENRMEEKENNLKDESPENESQGESKEEAQEAPKEEAPAAEESAPEAESKEVDNSSAIDEMKSEIKDLQKQVKDLSEVKAAKPKANHKAKVENKNEQDLKASENISPLSLIK